MIGLVAGLASVALDLLLTFPFVCFYEHGGCSILPPALLHTGSNAPVLLLLADAEQVSLAMPYLATVLGVLYAATVVLVPAWHNHVPPRGQVPPRSRVSE